MSADFGVLVMAYGTPAGPADLERYYRHIRHGRPVPPARLKELRDRYEAIGGRSPLREITFAQAEALMAELARRGHGEVPVAVGMKHARPFLENAAGSLADTGVERVIGLVMAPHYSAMSVGEYGHRAETGLGGRAELDLVRSWATAPGYVRLLADGVRGRLADLPEGSEVIFTAHSLPLRALVDGDPYMDELRATAEAVAEAAELDRWRIAWQSAGATDDAWLGPDLLEVLADLDAPGVVVCPAGFVADHLEVLYDLDVEAADAARRLGLPFARTPSPNASPELIAALADVVQARVAVRA